MAYPTISGLATASTETRALASSLWWTNGACSIATECDAIAVTCGCAEQAQAAGPPPEPERRHGQLPVFDPQQAMRPFSFTEQQDRCACFGLCPAQFAVQPTQTHGASAGWNAARRAVASTMVARTACIPWIISPRRNQGDIANPPLEQRLHRAPPPLKANAREAPAHSELLRCSARWHRCTD
jgi:hypothetical protein